MRLTFYDTRIDEDGRTVLIKERAVNYTCEKLNTAARVVALARDVLQMDKLAEEHCYLIAQNNCFKVLGVFLISKGTVSMCSISPREVFLKALLIGAKSVVLCHNHPSGDVTPSKEDVNVTQRMLEAANLLDIQFNDHIIIGEDGYYSFAETNQLELLKS